MYSDLEVAANFASSDQLFLQFVLVNLKPYQNKTEVCFYFFHSFFPKRERKETETKVFKWRKNKHLRF